MTVVEMEAKKAELARTILNINSEEVLDELSKTLKKLSGKMPCMYTPEEMQAGAERFIKAYKSGDKSRFIPHEEMEKRHVL